MLWIAATSLLLNMADIVRLVAEAVQLIGLVLTETFHAWLCMTFCWDDLRSIWCIKGSQVADIYMM